MVLSQLHQVTMLYQRVRLKFLALVGITGQPIPHDSQSANEVVYRSSEPLKIVQRDRLFEEIVLHGKDSTESGDI